MQPVQSPVVGSSAQHRRRVAVCDVGVPAAAEVVFNDEVNAELEDVADLHQLLAVGRPQQNKFAQRSDTLMIHAQRARSEHCSKRKLATAKEHKKTWRRSCNSQRQATL